MRGGLKVTGETMFTGKGKRPGTPSVGGVNGRCAFFLFPTRGNVLSSQAGHAEITPTNLYRRHIAFRRRYA